VTKGTQHQDRKGTTGSAVGIEITDDKDPFAFPDRAAKDRHGLPKASHTVWRYQ
jgi:hypothetical protein